MAVEIKVPTLGESVREATVGKWMKAAGDAVAADEPLVELETDKVAVEVVAPMAGVLGPIVAAEGATVAVGAVLGSVVEGTGAPAKPTAAPSSKPAAAPAPVETQAPAPTPAAPPSTPRPVPTAQPASPPTQKGPVTIPAPSSRTLEELMRTAHEAPPAGAAAAQAPTPAAPRAPSPEADAKREERVRMSRLRQTIARRLKEAQSTAAMLTTFNDVDMGAIMDLRKSYKELFEQKHGVKLGFMGFFVKACVMALKEIPAVNAEIDGTDIIYKNYYHIGVAVGTDRGLVVPVVREADHMSLADIERTIADFGARARAGKLAIEEMQGGTFTISNGGVYGSMLSTPILNAPQSGILGMHRIEERAVVRAGQIVARPMMYLALSYDHRIVDGKEAVTFLVRVKEALEDPKRMMLEL
ncbi:MAG: 2-oxoglutarate dehydrogenase complex dihydrolipoyllysine-residue succinyltransferase [Hyphomicrobiaceae bacterium]